MKFNKIVLYDLKFEPLEKGFVDKLKEFGKEVKIVLAEGEYTKQLKKSDLKGADALILRIFDYYDDPLFKNSNLKYIGSMHTDTSDFNKKLLNKKGITLTNVPGYATEAVAELTISALLNISRKTHDSMKFVEGGGWGFEKFLGWELKDKTLGIVGLGRIGKRVAEIADNLGMKVIYYSKHKKDVPYEFLELDELLEESDVVSLHCALNKNTENILNKNNLDLMKQGTVLLNSARMELVDLKALYDFCKENKVFVWFDELQSKEWRSKFVKLDNAYLTPDYGWMTREAQERLRDITLKNIKSYLGGDPQNRVV